LTWLHDNLYQSFVSSRFLYIFRYKRKTAQRGILKGEIEQSESFLCNRDSLKSYIDHSSGSGSGIPFLVCLVYCEIDSFS
jgi:hypothetical protein